MFWENILVRYFSIASDIGQFLTKSLIRQNQLLSDIFSGKRTKINVYCSDGVFNLKVHNII